MPWWSHGAAYRIGMAALLTVFLLVTFAVGLLVTLLRVMPCWDSECPLHGESQIDMTDPAANDCTRSVPLARVWAATRR